jgi:hypothetical protein
MISYSARFQMYDIVCGKNPDEVATGHSKVKAALSGYTHCIVQGPSRGIRKWWQAQISGY